MTSTSQLDHTVINVRYDMDAAERLFGQLGFTLTPRGYHSHGSMNHLMMFQSDYLELLGLPEGRDIDRKDLRDAPVGINGLVFKTGNADDTFAHMQSVGVAGDPPRAFHRPVDMQGEQRNVHFRTVTARPDAFPGGRVYFCEHGNPELVWRPEWQDHANGVVGIPEFVSVAEDAAGEAADFAKLLDGDVETDADGARFVAVDGGRITVLAPDQYAARYGALASGMNGRAAIFGALVLATADMAALNALLSGTPAGITVQPGDPRILVRVDAFDALLEFVAA